MTFPASSTCQVVPARNIHSNIACALPSMPAIAQIFLPWACLSPAMSVITWRNSSVVDPMESCPASVMRSLRMIGKLVRYGFSLGTP